MEKINKYYIPTTEELLEVIINKEAFYTNCDKEEDMHTFGYSKLPIEDTLHSFVEMNNCRVIPNGNEITKIYFINPSQYLLKYLDREDVESLGFVCTGDSGEEKEFHHHLNSGISWLIISMSFDNEVLIEKEFLSDTIGHTNTLVLFKGVIKNKSELKKVLKMVKVND